MFISLPELSLIVLIGPSGAGKSTFARRHFKPTEILNSDACRAMICDDENDQTVTPQAFELLHEIAARRLAAGRLTVIDATNVRPEDRWPLVQLARRFHCLPVAIVFDLPGRLCRERNDARPDRAFTYDVVRRQQGALRRSLRFLRKEGFRHVHTFRTPEDVEAAAVERVPLWTNRRHERGPFDIIGDVHGCFDELAELLERLGYRIETAPVAPASAAPDCPDFAQGSESESPALPSAPKSPNRDGGPGRDRGAVNPEMPAFAADDLGFRVTPPAGRKAVFVGDLVDRGPASPRVLRLVMSMVADGTALCVPGNHDEKLLRKLRGKNVQIAHGLAETLEQLDREPPEFREQVREFLDSLISHYVLDEGRLVVAHAGMRAEMQGRASGAVREFALYGETTGETDEFGLPVRCDWAADYRGAACVVYGHTPVPEPEWLNRTINIDTGCVYGGRLTALRYPERELVSVPARRAYGGSKKRLAAQRAAEIERDDGRGRDAGSPTRPAEDLSAQQRHDDLLDIGDLLGKRIIPTRLQRSVIVNADQSAAALEVMSRFAADPRWLIYLPPTMSPCATSREPDWLEHPREAFDYYRREGLPRVVCQEKHMGSRAVAIVCRDQTAARRRFGVGEGQGGVIYTRTGRRFFDDRTREAELLARAAAAMSESGLWGELETDWICLDCELMPWSAKAQSLLQGQYAAVGAAARVSLSESISALAPAAACNEHHAASMEADNPAMLEANHGRIGRDPAPSVESDGKPPPPSESARAGAAALLERYERRAELAGRYVAAYRRYCWPVESVADLKLAPFHVLATERGVHVHRDHGWHMETISRLCAADPQVLLATPWRTVDLTDPASERAAVDWWLELTGRGGEGMVVKPWDFIARGTQGLVQPAVKCRGREYLRIIYGPEYTLPEHLERLRARALRHKRSLAIREFALGVEALERFARGEPLRRVHECVFGVLAMESDQVDPRL